MRFGPEDNDWLPVAGDFDGDGEASVGLYSQEYGKLYVDDDLDDETDQTVLPISAQGRNR